MTPEEALDELLLRIDCEGEYVGWIPPRSGGEPIIVVDGHFTLAQLQEIVKFFESKCHLGEAEKGGS